MYEMTWWHRNINLTWNINNTYSRPLGPILPYMRLRYKNLFFMFMFTYAIFLPAYNFSFMEKNAARAYISGLCGYKIVYKIIQKSSTFSYCFVSFYFVFFFLFHLDPWCSSPFVLVRQYMSRNDRFRFYWLLVFFSNWYLLLLFVLVSSFQLYLQYFVYFFPIFASATHRQ